MNKPVNRFTLQITLFCLVGQLLSACAAPTLLPTPAPTAPPPPPAIVSATDASTLPALVVAERDASIQGNAPLLATLWAEDARIVDGRGTTTTADDYIWTGRAAILDRYELAVFRAPPPPLALDELATATVIVDGDTATLTNGGDRWRFTQRDGRWWLHALVYSSPAP